MNKIEENKRVKYIKSEYKKGTEVIQFTRLPFQFLGHDLTPRDGSVQSDRQKEYHNISKETKFEIVDFNNKTNNK